MHGVLESGAPASERCMLHARGLCRTATILPQYVMQWFDMHACWFILTEHSNSSYLDLCDDVSRLILTASFMWSSDILSDRLPPVNCVNTKKTLSVSVDWSNSKPFIYWCNNLVN